MYIRFIIAVIVSYVLYFALYTGGEMLLLPGVAETMAHIRRPAEDPLMMWAPVGYAIQTIGFVGLFWFFVRSNDLMTGIKYGAWFAFYLTGIDFATAGNMLVDPKISLTFIPAHFVANIVVAVVLTKIYTDTGKGETV